MMRSCPKGECQELTSDLLHQSRIILHVNIARRFQEAASEAVDSEAFVLEENQALATEDTVYIRYCIGNRFIKPLLPFLQLSYPEPLFVRES